MKVSAYLQVVPRRNSNGDVKDVSVNKVTQTYPRSPQPGALVLEFILDIEESVFDVPAIEVNIEADHRQYVEGAVIPMPPPREEEW